VKGAGRSADEGPWRRDPLGFAGRVELLVHESEALRGNQAGDPHRRELPVYLPPAALRPGARLPVVFVLVGFTGRAHSQLETHPWRLGLVARYDRAVARGEAPPAILVVPDCFTRLGGSQYVDSSFNGRHAQYVARELVALVDARYPTAPGRRALAGKSSGGFGALHLGMRWPETFPVVASISGDCGFEHGYANELLIAARALERHGGDPERFLTEFLARPKLDQESHAALNLLALSACYSPEPSSALGYELPIDLATGERVERVWRRWLAFDPLEDCVRHAAALQRLELLHLECGRRDEFHLQFGLRLLARRLRELGVPHVHEEHDGGHFDLDARWDLLLPRLIERLSG
jgi:enterochelin esterase family protein